MQVVVTMPAGGVSSHAFVLSFNAGHPVGCHPRGSYAARPAAVHPDVIHCFVPGALQALSIFLAQAKHAIKANEVWDAEAAVGEGDEDHTLE